MRRRVRSWSQVAGLALGLTWPVGAAAAPDSDPVPSIAPEGSGEPVAESEVDPDAVAIQDAKRHYDEATALYDEKRYAEAAAEFRRSYLALAIPRTLYNMALAYEKAGDVIAAIRAYEEYLDVPDLAPDRRAEVVALSSGLRANVGELVLKVEEGAEFREIRVDGKVIPRSDFPLLIVPGEVEVKIFGRGSGDLRERKYRVDGGVTVTVEVAAFREKPPSVPEPQVDGTNRPPKEVRPAAPDRAAVRAERQRRVRPWFWAGLGLSLATGAATVVLGVLAKREQRRFFDRVCPHPCTDQEQKDEFPYPLETEERARSYKTATNAMVGVTGALGLTTLVLGILSYGGGKTVKSPGRASVSAGGLTLRF